MVGGWERGVGGGEASEKSPESIRPVRLFLRLLAQQHVRKLWKLTWSIGLGRRVSALSPAARQGCVGLSRVLGWRGSSFACFYD